MHRSISVIPMRPSHESRTAHCLRIGGVLLVALCLPVLTHATTSKTSDQKLTQMVAGIISYTQWPQLSEPVHVCVIDSPYYFGVLSTLQSQPQQRIRVSAKTAQTEGLTQQCHVLFFEQTPPAQQQAIINQRGVHQILTLTLNNPSCAVGSSFCIQIAQGQPSFHLNLDSLKQSGVKISSRVLILAKPSPVQE